MEDFVANKTKEMSNIGTSPDDEAKEETTIKESIERYNAPSEKTKFERSLMQ